MKGKIFKNKYNKLSLRGEDGQFYKIGKSLQTYGDGAEVEFEVTESTYNGETQKWANASKKEETPAKKSDIETPAKKETTETGTAPQNSGNLMVTLIKGVAALVNEQKETNRLLGELLKKGGNGTNPVQPKTTAQEQPKKDELGDLPF